MTTVQPRADKHERGRGGSVPASGAEQRPTASDADSEAVAGHVLIWPGRAIYLGPLLENHEHRHHAVQISIALQDGLSLQAPPDRRWRSFRAVATAPDQPHRIRCTGNVAQIYLDPESAAGLAVRQRMGGAGVQAVDIDHIDHLGAFAPGLLPRYGEQPDAARAARSIDEIAGRVTPDFSRDLIDPRVQKTLTTVHALPGRHSSLSALAEEVSLSPSRLGALFRRDIGIPIRRYLLWLRLIDAIGALSSGANLTRAAHEAGFSDSAHLSRTFHRMFGMPPSVLQTQQVEVHDFAAGAPAAPWWTSPSAGTAGR